MSDDFDFWGDMLSIPCGGYDSETDERILAVVEMIGRDDKSFITDIAERLGMAQDHVALVQYILTNAKVDGIEVFTYGTSPRGLFVNDEKAYWKFLKALRNQVSSWNPTEQFEA